jgi:hypothetical protein
MWRRFFDQNPYAGFDPSPYPDDLQGWHADDPVFATLIDYVRPRLIVEVGTWKGASAINMARLCRERGLPTQIICIDTWLGSITAYLGREQSPLIHKSLSHRNGWPQVYFQFLANVVRHGFQGVITPLPQTSDIGAKLLAHFGIVPDLVYIDASHDYDNTYRDLVAYSNLLRAGGVLFGDDYIDWEGVTRAVNEIAAQSKHVVWCRQPKYVFLKGGDPRAIPNLA